MSAVHNLKIWPEHFRPVVQGLKPWEIRKNDRDYQVGDGLCLREFNPQAGLGVNQYTGEKVYRRIVHIVHGPAPGLEKGYCIMTLGYE